MGKWLVDRVAIVLALLVLASAALTLCSLVWPFVLVHHREDWHTADPATTTAVTNAVGMHVTAIDLLETFSNGSHHALIQQPYPGSAGRPDSNPIEQTDRTFSMHRLAGGQVPNGMGRPLLFSPLAVVALLGLFAIVIVHWRRRRGPVAFWPTVGGWALTSIVFALELLVVAAIVFCVRSYPYFERVDWRVIDDPAAVQVNSSRGSLMLAWTQSGPNHSLPQGTFLFVRSTIPAQRGPLYEAAELQPGYHRAIGFTLGTDGGSGLGLNVLIMPYWFVIALPGGVAFGLGRVASRRRRAAQRAAQGRCRVCGYDLRGGQSRCPECGTATSEPASRYVASAPTA